MATACYVPRYVPASFKGVPFEALEAGSEHGRRGAEGEFPFGETTAYADLGRAIRRYTISGRLAGNNHIAAASAVIAAAESTGPGVLMHPTRGAVIVACTRLSVRDGIDQEQGVTYLEFDFVEGNDWTSGFSFGAVLGGINLAGIIAAVTEHLTDFYVPNDIRWYQSTEVIGSARDVMQLISTQYQKAIAFDQTPKEWRMVADFTAIINDPFVLRDPDTFSTAFANGLALLDTTLTGEQKVGSFKQISNWGARSSRLGGEAAFAQNALYTATRTLATAYIVRGITESDTTTLDAALLEFDSVSRVLAEEAAVANTNCADPKFYLSLREFYVQVQTILLNRAYNLPALVTYKFSGPTHALVAAHEILGDAKRSRELESRNPQYLPWAFGPEVVASGIAS